jgi:hypothetical protein
VYYGEVEEELRDNLDPKCQSEGVGVEISFQHRLWLWADDMIPFIMKKKEATPPR